MLGFQRLDVYQRAIAFLIARCNAAAQLIADARYERGIHLLEGVVAMLTKMV
jgi:hypothetical protein